MKQTQEFDGKNIDHAVEKACSDLNVSKKKLVYDVISSGSTGIFGIVGVKKARIRVTLPEKESGSVGQDSAYDDDMAGVMSIVDEAFGEGNGKPEKKNVTQPLNKKTGQEESDSNSKPVSRTSETKKRSAHQKSSGPQEGQQSKGKTILDSGVQEDSKSDVKEEGADTAKPAGTKSKTYNKRNRSRRKVTPPKRPSQAHRGLEKSDNGQSESESSLGSSESGELSKISSGSEIMQPVSSDAAVNIASNISSSINASSSDNSDSSNANAVEGDSELLDNGGVSVVSDDPKGDSLLEPFDDRDEGYPPKYKGEIPVDVSEEAVRVGRETLQKNDLTDY